LPRPLQRALSIAPTCEITARVKRRRGVVPGLEVLARRRPRWLKDRRVGLLMHQASVTRRLESARDVLHRLCGPRLTALFGPQHGIAGELQDNMIESDH